MHLLAAFLDLCKEAAAWLTFQLGTAARDWMIPTMLLSLICRSCLTIRDVHASA